jgi:glucose/arabinose dehydrogenase
MILLRTSLALVIALAGCGDDDAATPDAGPRRDAGGRDAAGLDAGDAGETGEDAGGVDAGDPPACDPAPADLELNTEEAVTGLGDPVYVTQAPGRDDVLFIVEQDGEILIARDGTVLETPFFSIDVAFDGGNDERGLLGLAFHPGYAANGRFFIYYIAPSGDNRVAEYQRSDDNPDLADMTEVARLYDEDDFAGNHNGGMLAFGSDGFLYVGTGDGGGGGDPGQTALDLGNPFGKLLRLNVDGSGDYAAPGNPFAGMAGRLATVWAYGLRNPWRFSFDRLTHDLYIADVGQDEWEEVDVQPAASSGGECYGWSGWEGTHDFSVGRQDGCPDHVEPIVEYPHSGGGELEGSSITGGYVYRGTAIPSLQGTYLFADVGGPIYYLRWCDGALQGEAGRASGVPPGQVASFGEDNAGEVYIVQRNPGRILKIVP